MRRTKVIVILVSIILCFGNIGITAAPTTDIGINSNVAPAIALSITPAKKPVDIVILTDYTGSKLTALNTQINALKANFAAVNVDPVFHVINDVKKIGTQQDESYMYRRYGRFIYTVADYKYYRDYGLHIHEAPRTFEETELWEEKQGFKGIPSSLPVRNPQNVTFTKQYIEDYGEEHTSDYIHKYYKVTLSCTNDIKSSDEFIEEQYIKYYYSAIEKFYTSLQEERAVVDSKWTREEKIADVNFDVYSLNFDRLNTLQLRTGSDRYMIFLSDAAEKDYSRTQGSYFSFGSMTDTLKNYISTNKFALYGVVPEKARSRTLYPDKVAEILPLAGTSLFYMQNGDVLQLGDVEKVSQYEVGETVQPDITADIGDVKQTLISDHTYYLMQNGTVKYFNSSKNQIVTFSGVPNIAKLFYNPRSRLHYILNTSGKIYLVDFFDNTIVSYNNSVVITDIMFVDSYAIFLTSSGVPYIEYVKRDVSTNIKTYSLLTRLQVKTNETFTDMPAIKGLEQYVARAKRYQVDPFVVLYTSGKIQQFRLFTNHLVYSGPNNRYESSIPSVVYEVNDIGETGVASIASCNTGVFVFKTDGSVRLVNCDWTDAFYDDDEDGRINYRKPAMRDSTISVSLSNIVKTQKSSLDSFFITDSSNNTYMYEGTNECKPPVIGITLTNLGKVKDIKELKIGSYLYMYILQEDGRVKQLRYYYRISGLNPIFYEAITLPYSNIKKIYTSTNAVYLLDKSGDVNGAGYSKYGQLGYVTNNFTASFVKPFTSNLTFDTSKTHYSLLDLFKAVTASEFYPAGQYNAAFDSIYRNYDNLSGAGSSYILLDEDLDYKVTYTDYESDPEHVRQWRISHDPDYFDSSMGLSRYHNPSGFTTNPPVRLDKAGRYVFNLKARDNPKNDDRFDNYRLWSLGNQNLYIYVHRRPIALQCITIDANGNGTFTVKAYDAGSYDPDHIVSRPDRGIVAREWRWKEASEMVWHYEQISKEDCSPDKAYVLQLKVKDAEGVWSDYNTVELEEGPPVALFDIEKDTIFAGERLLVKDKSFPQSFFPLDRWHWIVKKYDDKGALLPGIIQNEQFTTSNSGTDDMEGCDTNVKTDYADAGEGKYRIYLRVRDSRGLWSDGGTNSTYNLNNFYARVITVQESFRISNFRVVKIRDFHLESYYRNPVTGGYDDKPMGVGEMAIDYLNFNGLVDGLTKGYVFEFEIDTANFNEDADTIVILPHFYTCDDYLRDEEERDLYWENSRHEILRAGEGAHAAWAAVVLSAGDRQLKEGSRAAWRGSYLIPGTAWAVPLGTSSANAKTSRINRDIIVNFEIKGYRGGELKFDYNLKQWPPERTVAKHPYEVGDVIRYSHTRNNLDDIDVILNRP